MTNEAARGVEVEALARVLLRAVLDDFEAEFIEAEAATPWKNALLQATAVFASGYTPPPRGGN